MDEKENPKYAAIRGIGTSFIGEANGSDKNYSFSIFTEKPQDTVHLFESAIDLLSYATFAEIGGEGVEEENIYCHWQVSINQQKKLKKVKSLQRWSGH